MSFTVKIEGIEELKASLSDLEQNQFPFAYAKSLTRVAYESRTASINEMPKSLDRPTPFTLKQPYVEAATKTKLYSRLYMKGEVVTPGEHYLTHQVIGSRARPFRKFEAALYYAKILPPGHYIVPGRSCPMDVYGNIMRSTIIEIMKYFTEGGYSNINVYTAEKKARLATTKVTATKYTIGYAYFVVREGDGTKLHPGIWKRIGQQWSGRIEPIMMFIKSAVYEERYPFYDVGLGSFDEKWKAIFNEEMQNALNTAK